MTETIDYVNEFTKRVEEARASGEALERAKQRIVDLNRTSDNKGLEEILGAEAAGELKEAMQQKTEEEERELQLHALAHAANQGALQQYTEKYITNTIAKISPEHLTREYYSIAPQEIEGDDEHNKIVALHKKAHNLEEAIQSRDVEKVNKSVQELVVRLYKEEIKNVTEQIDANLKDEKIQEKYGAETVKTIKEAAIQLIASLRVAKLKISEETARSYARKELEEKLPDEKSKAEYARKNYLATYKSLKDEERGNIIPITYALAKGQPLRKAA